MNNIENDNNTVNDTINNETDDDNIIVYIYIHFIINTYQYGLIYFYVVSLYLFFLNL